MIPGIDFAGVVETSANPAFKPGDAVVLNGWGVGETHLGGMPQKARVKGDWLMPLPAGLSAEQAMAIGTAGYTAMLAVMALESVTACKPADGPALVTGAAGGVGSVAVSLLAQAGWRVIASTGRPNEAHYLKDLGAAEIIDRKPNCRNPADRSARSAGRPGVDSVGSHTLPICFAQTKYGGASRRLRPGAGHGSACQRRALHPARRVAARHRQRDGAQGAPHRGVGPAGARSRQGEAGVDHGGYSVRPGDSGGKSYP
jgi:acrylyl-CoA reductase (NADPH)